MRILLSNDDGIDSPGIQLLKKELEEEHEVWISAPDGERSGTSHSISLKVPVRFRQIDERSYSCGGSPADAVMFALLGAVPVIPELIISGINLGPNLGTDIIYSGTAAAARQGALSGIPSVAVSAAPMKPPFPFAEAARFIRRNVEVFLSIWGSDHFININYPLHPGAAPKVAVTHPSRRIYTDTASFCTGPNGDRFYFLSGSKVHAREEEGSDWNAVQEKKISISPVFLHPLNEKEDEIYRNTEFIVHD
jgi:5'-nucleotidase